MSDDRAWFAKQGRQYRLRRRTDDDGFAPIYTHVLARIEEGTIEHIEIETDPLDEATWDAAIVHADDDACARLECILGARRAFKADGPMLIAWWASIVMSGLGLDETFVGSVQ